MFYESILEEKRGKLGRGEEEVVDFIDLARSLLTCSMRYGETNVFLGYLFKLGQLRLSWDFTDFDCLIKYALLDVETTERIMADLEWLIAAKD